MHLQDLHFNFLQKENIKICSFWGLSKSVKISDENLFFRCCMKLWKLLEKVVKNDICWCKIEHKTTRNKRCGGCILQTIIRSTFKTSSTMGYSRKEKHTENCARLCYISWKLQDQKPRPLETPHFFFVTPGNSTCYFLTVTSLEILCLQPPRCFVFFLE